MNIANKFNGLHVFYNDKVFLLTARKIAHSQCKKIFNFKSVEAFNVDLDTFEIQITNLNPPENLVKRYEDSNIIWNSFLEKSEKRDLVILYREPFEHFISSFFQDFKTNPNTANKLAFSSLFYYFLNHIPGSPLEKEQFISRYNTEGLSEKLFYDHTNIFQEFIKMAFNYYISFGEYSHNHYTQWLTFISTLYNSDKIDKNKIKFVDIYENPIEVQLQPYFEKKLYNNVYTNYKVHNFIFKYITEIIIKNEKYNKIVTNILNSEIQFYKKIKNNKL